MRIKSYLLASVFLISTQAFSFPQSPEACPSIEAIKSISNYDVQLGCIGDGCWKAFTGWRIYTTSNFDTKLSWNLTTSSINAESEEDATNQFKLMQSSLSTAKGPALVPPCPTPPVWRCEYKTPYGTIYTTTFGK